MTRRAILALAAAVLLTGYLCLPPARANDPLRRGGDFLGSTPDQLLRDLGAPKRLIYEDDTAIWLYEALDRSDLKLVIHHERVVFVDGDARLELMRRALPVVRDGEIQLEDGRVYRLSECPPVTQSGVYLGQPVAEALTRLGPAESFRLSAGSLALDYGDRGEVFLRGDRVVGLAD